MISACSSVLVSSLTKPLSLQRSAAVKNYYKPPPFLPHYLTEGILAALQIHLYIYINHSTMFTAYFISYGFHFNGAVLVARPVG